MTYAQNFTICGDVLIFGRTHCFPACDYLNRLRLDVTYVGFKKQPVQDNGLSISTTIQLKWLCRLGLVVLLKIYVKKKKTYILFRVPKDISKLVKFLHHAKQRDLNFFSQLCVIYGVFFGIICKILKKYIT